VDPSAVITARVPTPWGKQPKAQLVSGLTVSSWVTPDIEPRRRRYFEDLFQADVEIAVLVRHPPAPLALERLLVTAAALPPDVRWGFGRGLIRVLAPKPARPVLHALPGDELTVPSLPRQQWHELPDIWERLPPPKIRTQVSALPQASERVVFERAAPPRPRQDKTYRDLRLRKFAAAPARPVMPTSLIRESTSWRQMPPALAKWAIEKGITRAEEPPPRRPDLSALPSRKQAVMAALYAGDWVRVSELDIFPPRLRQWLEDCEVEFVRCFGFGRAGGGQGPTTPVNGYVTEDGTIFYCAEDGTTFYVQES